MPYDQEYFERYQRQADTEIGNRLNQARLDLVGRYHPEWEYPNLVDVGIGSGKFVDSRDDFLGYDVNPAGIAYLGDNFCDFYKEKAYSLSFWDSLEHIERPDLAVACAERFVFVSIPTFDGAENVLQSKHFRKDEHIWYWTADGFADWMKRQGFEELERNTMETDIGREGITSYAFRRINAPEV